MLWDYLAERHVKENLSKIIEKNKIDFSIINGENAADDGKGITKKIAENLFSMGIDVITSGNHIWDKQEILRYIETESRLLKTSKSSQELPEKDLESILTKDKKFKIGVINLMGNVFMRKTMMFLNQQKISLEKIVLKKNVDFSVVDFHGEITSEKWLSDIFLMDNYLCCWHAYSCTNS